MPRRDPLAVVVLGPTASGKTSLSLALARRFNGEIVNCDSVAMYREFEIGTAKPSSAERASVPHHLLDFVAPAAHVTAGEYARQGRQAMREISARHRTPIIAGGTGLYLKALLEGLSPGPQRSEGLRARLRTRSPEHLHKILRRQDAAAAARIHANDVPKIIRAIEVCMASRQPMTELWEEGRDPLSGFRILRLGLNPGRNPLYSRINLRAAQMFEHGLIAEAERLMAKFGEQCRPLGSLGYRQAVQFLCGELDRNQALSAAQQAHRNYAKRQLTWFRREPDVHWLTGFGDNSDIQAEAAGIVERER